jgi:hypothetical protein
MVSVSAIAAVPLRSAPTPVDVDLGGHPRRMAALAFGRALRVIMTCPS